MAAISLIRHQSIINPSEHNRIPIHIIGVGATGSRVFMSLIELGFENITCYDPDIVEAHNLANQAFVHIHQGVSKVEACSHLYTIKTGYPAPQKMRFKQVALPAEGEKLNGIVFLLTDSMASRRDIYENCIKGQRIRLVIETRMASSYGNVLVFKPGKQDDWWLSTLIDDGAAEVSPCGSSISVGPTASIIANLAVWQMIHYLQDPLCMDSKINVFLKPTILGVESCTSQPTA